MGKKNIQIEKQINILEKIPMKISNFLVSFVSTAKEMHLKYKNIYLYGGSIRDIIMERDINDYDITTGFNNRETKRILNKMNLDVEKRENCPFVYTHMGDKEIQFGEKETVPVDFTINSFKFFISSKKLIGAKTAMKDLQKGIIKQHEDKSSRIFRRALYMLYKYPTFKISSSTKKEMKKMKLNKKKIISFLKDKSMPIEDFISIGREVGLKIHL